MEINSGFLVIVGFVKISIILIGLILTFWHLIKGLSNKDAKGKTKAMKYFFGTAVIFIAISILEFLAIFYRK